MVNQQIFRLLEQVSSYLGTDMDPVALRDATYPIPQDVLANISDFQGAINQAGQSVNLTFLQNGLEKDLFEEMLQEMVFPVIYVTESVPAKAFLIFRDGKGPWDVTQFGEGAGSTQQVATMADLRLLIELSQDQGHVQVLTPMVIDPLVSEASGEPKRTAFGRLWSLLRSERKDIFYIYIYAVMVGLLSLTLPLGVQAIVGQVSGGLIMEPVVILITFVILGTLISGGLQIMQAAIVERLHQRLFTRAAFEFAFRIPRIKAEALLKYYAPELINRFFDILTIQKGFSKILTEFISSGLNILFGLMLLSFYHPFFVFFGLFMLLFLFLIFYLTGPRGLRTSLDESDHKYKTAHWLEELGRNLISFKLAGNTNLPLEKTDRHVSGYLAARKAHFKVLIAQMVSIVTFKTVITGGLLILGSLLVIDRRITLGQFVASEIVIITILNAVEKIFLSLDVFYDLLTAVEKIAKVTDLPLDRQTGALSCSKASGAALKVKNLGYDDPVGHGSLLQDISFELEPGQSLGITGYEGAGKTLLLRLLTGSMENYQGKIALDGISLRDWNMATLRRRIGDNLDSETVFEGSLLENITMGDPNISLEQALDVVRSVGLSDFTDGIRGGISEPMLAGGKYLPSSVVRKLILARSILKKPRLLILDNFFSDAGGRDRKQLLNLLVHQPHDWTTVLVSHDAEVLSKCDKVLVMKDGKGVLVDQLSDYPGELDFLNNKTA